MDEPCGAFGTCDAGLACDGALCRTTVLARFCHCIYQTAGMVPLQLEMQMGGVVLGPTPADVCSPCVPIATGPDLHYEIRGVDGTRYVSGDTAIASDPPQIAFAYSIDGVLYGPIDCDRAITGFCR